MLSAKAIIKLRAADSVEEGRKFVLPDVLGSHLFFDPRILELKSFWDRLDEAFPVSEGMSTAFKEKNLIGFQPHIDDFCERAYEWYSEHFEEFLSLLDGEKILN